VFLFRKYFFIFCLYLFINTSARSQSDSLSHPDSISLSIGNALIDTAGFKSNDQVAVFNKKRFALVVSAEAALYAGSLVGLNELWYKDYPRSSFHFFDDNDEWLQMDKTGHFTTSYYVGRIGVGFMKWTGVSRKKAIWYGGMLGFLYQSTIEVMDAYSSEWGFSTGDLAANTAGSLLCIGQELAWNEQRIVLKYSFMQSPYAKYRPGLLGNDLQENVLKDYNGQTYWLSINPSSFMKKETRFPKWLNIALGYGAEGMTGGKSNPIYIDEAGHQVNFDRFRQYYLSFDVDLTRIKTKSKFLRTFFYTVGFLKIPAPALEFSKYGVSANWLGF
jgi:hypothetical protein